MDILQGQSGRLGPTSPIARLSPRPVPLPTQIQLLVTRDCPHADAAFALLQSVRGSFAAESDFERVIVRSSSDLHRFKFPGSPTIRVNGRDVDPDPPAQPANACRMYGSKGIPDRWMIEAALLRALEPERILFLCVANSARSQMAEGIARAIAPAGVHVSSAGSEPSTLRPQAVAALDEVGIDIRGHRSKGTDEVDRSVDAVITLCAEEVCPVWVSAAVRLHWDLPDPVGGSTTNAQEMEAFRRVRDELQTRLTALLA